MTAHVRIGLDPTRHRFGALDALKLRRMGTSPKPPAPSPFHPLGWCCVISMLLVRLSIVSRARTRILFEDGAKVLACRESALHRNIGYGVIGGSQ